MATKTYEKSKWKRAEDKYDGMLALALKEKIAMVANGPKVCLLVKD
jgi:hypothetical protein